MSEETSQTHLQKRLRLIIFAAAFTAVVTAVTVYGRRNPVSNNILGRSAHFIPPETSLQIQTNLKKVRQDSVNAGFTEVLFCGYTEAGNHFWKEFGGGLSLLADDAAKPLNEYIIRMVNGVTKEFVESTGLLGGDTVNGNLDIDQVLSMGVSDANVAKNWKGTLLAKLQHTAADCTSNAQGSFKQGAVYNACGKGLSVSKLDNWCEWTWRDANRSPDVNKGTLSADYFLLYYKKATKCEINSNHVAQPSIPPPVKITDTYYSTVLQKMTGCGRGKITIARANAQPSEANMFGLAGYAMGCVKPGQWLFLYNRKTGAYEINKVTATKTHDVFTWVTFAKPLKTKAYLGVTRIISSKGDLIVEKGTGALTGEGLSNDVGGVLALMSERGKLVINRNIDMTRLGFAGAQRGKGPFGVNGEVLTGGGGGGGGSPGHGCGGSAGWKTNQMGLGVDGGGNPWYDGHRANRGGKGGPNGGGAGGSGYGWETGTGGVAVSPGGNGGDKVANRAKPGQNARGPSGGGSGGGADRDNGGGGGGGRPVSSGGPNQSSKTNLFLGGGSACGGGGGGGGAGGDYKCAQGGGGGHMLGPGGKIGVSNSGGVPSQNGYSGGNGNRGGGIIVLIGKSIVIDQGVKVMSNGGAGGTGGTGGAGKVVPGGNPVSGCGGGGGGAQGATGGTVVLVGPKSGSGVIEVKGGSGGAGGVGGKNSGARGNGGNGGNGAAGDAGVVVQLPAM